MLPEDELKALSKIIFPKENYHISIQEELELKDMMKRHKPKYDDETIQIILEDKVFGILGG